MRSLIILFMLSLALRLGFNFNHVPFWSGDQPSLFDYTLLVVKGQYYGTEGVYWPPGFIIFMGLIFRLIGVPSTPEILSVKVLQSFLGACTTLFMALTATRMFKERRAGFLAGALHALLPTAILYTGFYYAETLFTFLLFFGIWLAFVAIDREQPLLFAASGAVLGLATLTRPVALPLAPLVAIPVFLKHGFTWVSLRRTLITTLCVLGAMGLTMLPWVIRNYYVVHEFVLTDVNGGINLYIAHNPRAKGGWVDLGPNDPVLLLGDRPAADREGKRRAMLYIKAHPRETLAQAGKVNKWFWTRENEGVAFAPRWLRVVYKLYSFKALALGAAIGAILSLSHWKRTAWILLYMASYNLLIAFLYYADRYRFPIEPFLVLFAGYTAMKLLQWVERLLDRLNVARG